MNLKSLWWIRFPEHLWYTPPANETGKFSFNLTKGIYELHFEGEGYQELIRPLKIDEKSKKAGIQLEDDLVLQLIEEAVIAPLIFVGEDSKIQLKDSLYTGSAGEPIIVPLKLEKGGILITRIYQDSVLISTDTLEAGETQNPDRTYSAHRHKHR